MKFPKITKTLPLVLALAMTTSCAFAADEVPGTGEGTQSTINAVYQLTLDTFFDIDVKAPSAAVVSVDEDYTTLQITNSMTGLFEVVSNTPEKTFYLYGKCDTDTDAQNALYGTIDGLKVVFTNSEAGSKAKVAAVTHITGGGQDSKLSPNAIAFNLTPSYKHEETPTNGWLTDPSFDDEKVTYSAANGKHTLTYTITGSAQDKSFSTMDTKGLYKATLMVSDVPTL